MDKEKLIAYWNGLKEQPNKVIALAFSALAILIALIVLIGVSCSHDDEPIEDSDSAVVSATDNIFMVAEEHLIAYDEGGVCRYIYLNKEDAKAAPPEDFAEFARTRVPNSHTMTYCVRFSDDTGIIFYGCDPANAQYGKLSLQLEMLEPYGYIIPTDDGLFEYHPFDSEEENLSLLFDELQFKSWSIEGIPCAFRYNDTSFSITSINSYEDVKDGSYYLYMILQFDVSDLDADTLAKLLDEDMELRLLMTNKELGFTAQRAHSIGSQRTDDGSLYCVFSSYLLKGAANSFEATDVYMELEIQQERDTDYYYSYVYSFRVRNDPPGIDTIAEPLQSDIVKWTNKIREDGHH